MISKEKFSEMKFTSFGFVEPIYERESYRLPAGHRLTNHSTVTLRNKISNLIHDIKDQRHISIRALVEDECNINFDTYKKCINGSGGRHPSRLFVAKLCVGLKLSIDVANDLFRIEGGELNLTNDVDAITYYAILDKDNILDYEAELEEKAGITV